jgi:uncharacterized protein (UPF0216 family)
MVEAIDRIIDRLIPAFSIDHPVVRQRLREILSEEICRILAENGNGQSMKED